MVKPVLSKEQVNAQHEKNTQEFQYKTNQSLQDLKNEIQNFKKSVDDLKASHSSAVTFSQTALINHKDFVNDATGKLSAVIGQHVSYVVNTLKGMQSEIDNVKQLYMDKDSCKAALQDLELRLSFIAEELDRFQGGHKSTLGAILSNYDSKLQEFKDHMLGLSLPGSEQLPALHQKISEAQTDKEGVLQELRALKKQVFIQSKYIEKLQTDLENRCPKSPV